MLNYYTINRNIIHNRKSPFVHKPWSRTLLHLFILTLTLLICAPDKLEAQWRDNDDYWTVTPFDMEKGTIEIRLLVRRFKEKNNTLITDYIQEATIWKHQSSSSDPIILIHLLGHENDVSVKEGKYFPVREETTVHMDDDQLNTYFYWKIFTLEINNLNKNLTQYSITGKWVLSSRNPNTSQSFDISGKKDVTIPKFGSIELAPLNFFTFYDKSKQTYQPALRIGYKKTLSELDRISQMTLDVNDHWRDYKNVSSVFTYDTIPITQGWYDGRYSYLEAAYYKPPRDGITERYPIDVPSFEMPLEAKATYDASKSTGIFTWTIHPISDSYKSNAISTDFKIQIANNPSFTDAIEKTVAYNTSDASFSYTTSQNLSPHMYFRVSRSFDNPDWKLWDVAKTADIEIPFISIKEESTNALLQDDKTAKISWNADPAAWLPGSAFIITKMNHTTGIRSEIKLGKAEFDKGTYIDKVISPCNEYHYALQVVPPSGSAFEAHPAVEVKDEVLNPNIGSLTSITSSKGYFPQRTQLTWQTTGAFNNFIIRRAEYGSDQYVQIATVQGSTDGNFEFNDEKGIPGVYYTYLITGSINCNNKIIYSKDTLRAIGFRSPTGNIHGRVLFKNGQAVPGAGVRIQSEDAMQFTNSIYFSGTENSYLSIDSISKINDIFTVEAWIKPADKAPANQVIISRKGQFEIGFNAAGNLYFDANGSVAEAGYKNTNNTFIHVTGVRSADSIKIFIDDSVIAGINAPVTPSVPEKGLRIGARESGQNYRGFIDEMRIWNTSQSDSALALNYDRFATGGEKNLVAYWRLDENMKDFFFDMAHDGMNYHKNDGLIHEGAWHVNVVPTAGQLSFKAYTDSTGNYMISGIPYTGNGTIYKVVPVLGTHQFDPVSDSRFLSDNTSDFAVNFTDKSSFPVSGSIYYANTTVPVTGVRFLIDGQYAQNGDGTFAETDDAGHFNITVPVGVHRVQASKSNHVFNQHGEILDSKGRHVDYQGPLSKIELFDSTTIRFIGRVTGGTIQADLPLGYSLSKNNLGKEMKIVLRLAGGAANISLNTRESMFREVVQHQKISGSSSGQKSHSTVVNYFSDRIEIHPDSITGEFTANIIPEKFYTDEATATHWGNILNEKKQFNFTNKFVDFQTSYEHEDSVYKDPARPELGYNYTTYTDSVSYNDSALIVKRVLPSLRIVQIGDDGNALPYFGDSTYEYRLIDGTKITSKLVDFTKPGKSMYLLDHPVFCQNLRYLFKIKSFESYPYCENESGPAIRTDLVPLKDGKITINNEMAAGTSGPQVLTLDDKGEVDYHFYAGEADLSDALQSFSASLRVGKSITVKWLDYKGDPVMQAYNLGSRTSGTDFVTQGPDQILMVLRDPPGSRSYSYAEKNTTFRKTRTWSAQMAQEGGGTVTASLGPKLQTFIGIGAGTIMDVETTADMSLTVKHEEHWENSHQITQTNTITERFQTSDDPAFVGALGDVFVGHSTNITYGTGSTLLIINKQMDEVLPGDEVYFSTSDYAVVKRNSLQIGQQFGTLFAFTQQYIEYQLIPHLKDFIRNVLTKYPVNYSPAAAQQAANKTNTSVYISHLPVDHKWFGKQNRDPVFGNISEKNYYDGSSYTIYFPNNTTNNNDTIKTLNIFVNKWTSELRKNEEAKLKATLTQNYSFHSGSPIEHSEQMGAGADTTSKFSFIVSGSVGGKLGVLVNNVGIEYEIEEGVGGGEDEESSQSSEISNTFGFTLASDGSENYFSVDVKKAVDSSGFVFITRGGESACPYEGESVTKYYNPGTRMNEATVQIENPKFDVDVHELNNVPSSRPAVFNLTLRNESDAKQGATYILGYVDNNSVKGATIAIDGQAIGGAGRPIVIQYGEEIQKVLTITKGPNELDYDSIMIVWHSACQYDPNSHFPPIADTQVISAHFIPSCTDISINTPSTHWVLNTKSPADTTGTRYLPIVIDKFDTTNPLFDHVTLQYKPSSSDRWQPAATFYPDSASWKKASEDNKFIISDPAAIEYNLKMNNTFFPDQSYDIQAVSTCITGLKSVVTLSNIVSGLKDTTTPRQFGNPLPSDGILGANDEIKLTFNEPIEGGLLNMDNFQVTAVKNMSQGDHSVSVRLDGENDYLSTEFAKNFSGKSITAEMWIKAEGTSGGTLFSQGNNAGSVELSITKDKRVRVVIGEQTFESYPVNETPDWTHVALVYNDQTKTVSAFYNFVEVIKGATVTSSPGTGLIEFGRSVKNKENFFKGQIHEARIWSKPLTFADLQINSLTNFSGNESGLLAYYPMKEGKGTIVYDKANGVNARLSGSWTTPPGKAIRFDEEGYLRLSTSAATISSTTSYTIELWFKGEVGQKDATLASNGKRDGTEIENSSNLFYLGFEDGLLTYKNSGFKVQTDENYLDNNWHHVAVAVEHNAAVIRMFVDGELKKFVEAVRPGGIASPYIYLGARAWADKDSITVTQFDRYFKGSIDEFRLWDTYLNQTLLNKNNNVRLKANEFGLRAYYPFETYTTSASGIVTLDSSWQDMAVGSTHSYASGKNASYTDLTAPIKSSGPVSNLNFNYVVNNDAIIINLLEQKSAIDKTLVTISVRNAFDKNGNQMTSPITWTAFMNQNPLQWSEGELNLTKENNESMQFDCFIINSGGSNQDFAITNLPKWLSADITEGQLPPMGRQKITFTINERTNIGAYNEVVYLSNNEDQIDGLSINLNIKGKQPDWAVTPADFKYNMAIYGKIRIRGTYSANHDDLIAAFYKGRCVGVAGNTYSRRNDLWYAFLTVYNNKVNQDSLEYRIWEAATGKTYLAIPDRQIDFSNDAIIGSPRYPVLFEANEGVYQNIELKKGWNWISYNVSSPHFNDVNQALANGKWSSGDLIKNFDSFDQYSATSGWLGYLKKFTNQEMYMLNTANEQILSVLGDHVDISTTPIHLKGGRWNYISYLPNINLTVKQALAGYTPADGDVVKSQNGFAMYNSQNGWIGSLSYMQPGKGYMFYRRGLNDTSFYYPVNVDPLNERNSGSGASLNSLTMHSPAAFNFPNNLTMIAELESYTLLPGDLVFAHSVNGIRGKAEIKLNSVKNKESIFINICGEEGEPIYFTVQRNNEIIASSRVLLSYFSNRMIGTLEKPFIIKLENRNERINIYPNPFSGKVTITVDMEESGDTLKHQAQVFIYNSNGSLVFATQKVVVQKGHYEIQWDGSTNSGQYCPAGVYYVNVLADEKLSTRKIIKR